MGAPERNSVSRASRRVTGYDIRMKYSRSAVLHSFLAVFLCCPAALDLTGQEMGHSQTKVRSTHLKVQGLDGRAITLSPEEFAGLPHKTVSVFNSHTKVNEKYSGVPVSDLLAKVGAPLGEKVRGKLFLTGVIAEGADNYGVLYAIAEVDPTIHTGDVIVADSMDDHKLDKDGAFKIVSTEEKRCSRAPMSARCHRALRACR